MPFLLLLYLAAALLFALVFVRLILFAQSRFEENESADSFVMLNLIEAPSTLTEYSPTEPEGDTFALLD
jgi:hypothetical protein